MIDDARARLLDTIYAAHRYNPEICIEVFIHKVDALSEDHQSDLLAILQRRVEEEAKRRLETSAPLRLNFNLTSIYDHSVFQAFSLVVQKLIHHKTPYINELLQMLNSNSNVDLSYLFLSRSKIYLAADERNRLKARTYDLCSDAIEVVGKMSEVYRPVIRHSKQDQTEENNKRENLQHSIIHLSEDCIYVQELPNSLTIVLMLKKSELENRALIDLNIDTFYKATYSIFTA
ncbi:Gtr1/RagA G protein conserved region containing protein, putative [Angomonas deanei]|uniref:Gtr1/RagA G protein conserved region containing protein, putative n=1 Tax=Angomonas deanei TaxID=59799 RepID=A0A7G2C090_9TRYP|nr:Gtr1/RagA G protein conserved region containing protein, putative [Angomonas deanei]